MIIFNRIRLLFFCYSTYIWYTRVAFFIAGSLFVMHCAINIIRLILFLFLYEWRRSIKPCYFDCHVSLFPFILAFVEIYGLYVLCINKSQEPLLYLNLLLYFYHHFILYLLVVIPVLLKLSIWTLLRFCWVWMTNICKISLFFRIHNALTM